MTKGSGAGVLIAAECSNTIHGNRAIPLSKRPVLAAGDWAEYGAKMTEFASDALMANTKPPVHLLLDTGHATWGGANPASLAKRYKDRIGHIHCKDVRPAKIAEAGAKDLSFLDSIIGLGSELGVYTVPGDGAIDYVAVFRELVGYSGWVVLEAEQDPKKAPSLAYARRGVAHLRTAFAESGLV